MLPIAGPSLPRSADSLTTALREGLAAQNLPAREIVVSGDWPSLQTLRLDFTGLQLTRAQRPPRATAPGPEKLSAENLAITAAPLTFEQMPVELALTASRAELAFAQSADGQQLLTLEGAQHGEITIEVRREALEALLQSVAAEAAGQHGVDVKKTRIELTARGPRELAFRAEVTAKMFIVTAAVTLTGDLTVDDELVARLSNLRFGGEGMIANAAGGFIRPQLDKLEGRTFPLMAFSLGSIRLRDLQIAGGDSLRLSAQFGNA